MTMVFVHITQKAMAACNAARAFSNAEEIFGIFCFFLNLSQIAYLENRETVPVEDTVSPKTNHVTNIRDGVATKEDVPGVTEEPDSSERYGLTGMPVINVDGIDYAASVFIPSINIELPIADDSSLETLKISPVRYLGSLYDNDLVIVGHNYRAVFSKIKNMKPGDEVLVTDMRGETFSFTVSYTLLTCTFGGLKEYW